MPTMPTRRARRNPRPALLSATAIAGLLWNAGAVVCPDEHVAAGAPVQSIGYLDGKRLVVLIAASVPRGKRAALYERACFGRLTRDSTANDILPANVIRVDFGRAS